MTDEAYNLIDYTIFRMSGCSHDPFPSPSVANSGKRSTSAISLDEVSDLSEATVKCLDEDEGPFIPESRPLAVKNKRSIVVEAPYKKRMFGQCHRCQLYGHAAANNFALHKGLVPHLTKDYKRTKESGGKTSCCHCGEEHTVNYRGCPEGPKPKPVASKKNRSTQPKDRTVGKIHFPPIGDAVILFGDFNSKSENCNGNYSNNIGRRIEAFAESLHFNIVTPLTPAHYHSNGTYRPDILDITLMKEIALKLSCFETIQCLNSDHRPVLMRLGSHAGDCPPSTKTITNWQKVSTALEEIDIPILNSIVNYIASTNDIKNAIGVLTSHIRTMVENSSRIVPGKSDREELARDGRSVVEVARCGSAAGATDQGMIRRETLGLRRLDVHFRQRSGVDDVLGFQQ
ncbi:hypothetical protein EVAR_46392_1 [Eumeta japonica]|uniref:Endonuclease/exonuclease/phosphatase domain-containing protein n=1 Tax=Eumeta variegata TaxID=151549 RepID=A0A4C1WYH8_EUMVA|nr:hypothetical protein EVAR_46392_1 [Eumeta japonica]